MAIGAQKLVPPLLSTSVQPRWSSEMAYVSALWAEIEKISRDTVVLEVTWGGWSLGVLFGALTLARTY